MNLQTLNAVLFLRSSAFIMLMISLYGCKEKETYTPSYSTSHSKLEKEKQVLILGLADRSFYEPVDRIVTILNQKLKNTEVKIVAGSQYPDYLAKLHRGEYDLTFTNGLEALNGLTNGYEIAAKFESDSSYYAVIFTNKDAGINKLTDLKGKKFGLGGAGSILGDIAPRVFLYQNGINPYTDMKTHNFQSFESAIISAYLNKSDAGATWATSWNRYAATHPEVLNRLEVKWTTEKLPNIAIMLKKDIAPAVKREILKSLIELHSEKNGIKALQQMQFTKVISADSATYAPLRKLKAEFDKMPKK